MYAGFVGKGVASDNRLVGLHPEADYLRKQLARRIKLARIDCGFERQLIAAHIQRHHHLFQRGVTRPLADTVDRAFDLTGAGINRRETVRDGKTEIVVAMHADRNVFSIAYDAGANRPDQFREFSGESVTYGVRHVENSRAFSNCRGEDFAQIFWIAAGRVLGRKLNLFNQVAGQADRLPGHFNYFSAGLLQLVFEMDIRSRYEGVDAWADGFA